MHTIVKSTGRWESRKPNLGQSKASYRIFPRSLSSFTPCPQHVYGSCPWQGGGVLALWSPGAELVLHSVSSFLSLSVPQQIELRPGKIPPEVYSQSLHLRHTQPLRTPPYIPSLWTARTLHMHTPHLLQTGTPSTATLSGVCVPKCRVYSKRVTWKSCLYSIVNSNNSY